MKKLLYFSLLLAFSINTQAQRNVVLLIADDIGTDYFGFYEDHQDTVGVPHITALLNGGVRFVNAMSNPVCSATRAAMLTGRYGFRTGVGNIVGGAGGSGQLDVTEKTIPELLHVYNPAIATAQIGKWHLQNPVPASNLQNPNIMGFDHFEGPFIGAITNYYNWTKYTNGVSGTVTNYATIENVDNAVSWVKSQGSNPFFLWVAFNAPHSPFHLPPPGLYSDLTLTGTPQDINANPKKYFKASLEALDHEIGRLMDSLQAINRLDSTDFIFIGDNGNTIQTAQIANPNKSKGTIYQYGVHVPFIVSGPSVVDPGRSTNAIINTADVFATVLELFGNTGWQSQIPANKPVDSKSLLPIIKNQTGQIRDWTFAENFKTVPDSNDGKAIRNFDYKLLSFDDGHQEFYNLSVDSAELNDLLLGSLSPAELANYNYLCSELTTLIGVGNYCNGSVGEMESGDLDKNFEIYPNPASEVIHLNMNSVVEEKLVKEIAVYDSNGRVVYRFDHFEEKIFVGHLNKGIYLIRILTTENVLNKKLVIG